MAFQVDFSTKNVLLLAPKLRKLGGHNAPPPPGSYSFPEAELDRVKAQTY